MQFAIVFVALLAASVVFAQDAGPPPFTVELTAQTADVFICLVATVTYTPGGAAYYVDAIGPQD
jgi:hypothetical protein